MELRYIIALVAIGIFVILFLISLTCFYYSRNKAQMVKKEIEKMYNDPDLAKMDYDIAAYDEETNQLMSVESSEGQLTIEDFLDSTDLEDGLDEIMGNYTPD